MSTILRRRGLLHRRNPNRIGKRYPSGFSNLPAEKKEQVKKAGSSCLTQVLPGRQGEPVGLVLDPGAGSLPFTCQLTVLVEPPSCPEPCLGSGPLCFRPATVWLQYGPGHGPAGSHGHKRFAPVQLCRKEGGNVSVSPEFA